MLGRKDYTKQELDNATATVNKEVAAYKKLVADWQGKDTEEATTVIQWVTNALRNDLGEASHNYRAARAFGTVCMSRQSAAASRTSRRG